MDLLHTMYRIDGIEDAGFYGSKADLKKVHRYAKEHGEAFAKLRIL